MSWSVVDCAEEAGSIRENYTEDGGFNASVTLRCAWADRHALIADFYTNMPVWPYGSIIAYPISASVVPASSTWFESSGQIITNYGDSSALVTVNFSSAAEQTLISESFEPSVEAQILNHHLFMWSSDGGPLLEEEAPIRQVRGLTLVRTLHKIASIPVAVATEVGKCNSAQYVSALLGITFPAETLLFQPKGANRTITTSGSQGWDLQMAFIYKPEGWNYFWRAKTQVWDEIKIRSSGTVYKNIELGNFATLLF